MRVSIIAPCYNEEEGISNLASKLDPVLAKLQKEHEIEVIFIDDGSKDKTYEMLHKHFGKREYVKIIRHEANKNLGGALRTGFENSTGDIIVTIDSDCTYYPEEILEMLKLIKYADIVTASPYHPNGGVENVPRYRIFLSKSVSMIYRILTWSDIHTFTALFRAYRKEVIRDISFQSNNFLATAEILIYALKKGYRVREYPTVLHVRQFGTSSMKLLGVIWSHIKFIFMILVGR